MSDPGDVLLLLVHHRGTDMPATSPRICITMNDETHAALKRLSAVQGRPLASVIREMLDDAAPTVDALADSMEALKAAEASARAGIAGTLSEVAHELEPHLTGILGHLRAISDLGEGDRVGEASGDASWLRQGAHRSPRAPSATPV